MSHLEGIAADLGVAVIEVEQLPQGRWGEYRHRGRVIRLLGRLAPIQRRCTLAHELGHAIYGHRRSTARAELEADAWAARQLIDPAEWRQAAAAYDDLLTVAAELQVMPRIAAVYAVHLARHPAMRARADVVW